MILEIDNVELYFSNKKLLNGIYLKAQTGLVTGILGRNGCGKTSLLSIIFGALQPKYKLLRLDGKPILKPFYQTNHVHYLPQHGLIPNSMKIKNAFKLYKVDWFEFIKLFDTFSFFRNSKITTLSGGERRVIDTYLTIKSPKPVILLDEPFSHIAPLYIEKFKALIRIEKQTKVIILTDHYYNDVIEVTDNLYLLKDGHTKLIENLQELEDYEYLTVGMLN
jgi:ABC-type multidrug transport system ATPase subunit